MGTTLDNGIYLPDEGERNCYEGLAGNWVALDNHIGSTNIHVTINDKQAWDGHVEDTTIHVTSAEKQTWNSHVADTTIHVTSADKQAWDGHVADSVKHVTAEDKQTWNGKADASALTAHTGDTTIHVTSADKQAWNGKADASALTAHTGDTTIHVTSADKQAWNGHVADLVKHVTAEDKAKWDAVTSKADDSDVVHKSGNETVDGQKTFSHIQTGVGRDLYHFASSPYSKNTPPANISFQYIWFIGNSASQGLTNNWYGGYIEHRVYPNGSAQGRWFVRDTSESGLGIELFINGNDKQFRPQGNNITDLGTPTNKWKSFNGLEPSSLSLPSDRSARIDISSYFTNTGTGQSNSYTVPANGYIYLTLSELTNVNCFSRSSGNVTNYAQTFTKLSNSTGALYILFPVRKNDVFVATWYTTTTVSVDGAFFIPCKGNI